MKRRYLQVADELEAGLRAGTFGPAGEAFLSVLQIAAEYGISLDSACLVMTELCARRRIRLDGKHYYITTGYVRPDTPYGQRLAAARKPVFGMLLNAIESPFFAALAKELCEASEKNGYTLLIADSGNFPGREAQRIDSFLMSGASGLFAHARKTIWLAYNLPVRKLFGCARRGLLYARRNLPGVRQGASR